MTGPSYTVKNIEAIAEGSDMRARLYTLAPGDVIPWHYHTAVTDWYFCLVGILRVETRAPRGDERLAAQRPLPDPAEDGAPHLERWRRGLPVSAATRGRCLRLQQGSGLTEATAWQRRLQPRILGRDRIY